ncbi:replication initiation protein [Acinetobacter oleivorans]|uniref:replication initiation protein n=1 Tax=Acinetobacter oleivorans TaxID=1148157 RepID=UPI003AF572CA
MLNKTQFSADFYENLPYKPYCSDDLGHGIIIRPKRTAIQKQYIQHNPPCLITSLVFDIDRSDAYFAWSDANLPTPTWIAKNPKNCHAHIGYMLAMPVCTTHRARQNVIEYLAKIEQAYSLALGADRGYSGLITKNPCHTAWENHIFDVDPYELNYLADFVELQELKTDLKEVSGLGRNCMMFDNVRFWAYEAIRAFISGSYDVWHREVLNVAINANGAFIQPLPYSEVKATAKSIARWVWRNTNSAEFQSRFSVMQTTRANIGVQKANPSKGGKARSQQYSDIRQEALKLHIMGKSIKEITEILNVHRNSVSKWIKNP